MYDLGNKITQKTEIQTNQKEPQFMNRSIPKTIKRHQLKFTIRQEESLLLFLVDNAVASKQSYIPDLLLSYRFNVNVFSCCS